jgi:hypothetical protein
MDDFSDYSIPAYKEDHRDQYEYDYYGSPFGHNGLRDENDISIPFVLENDGSLTPYDKTLGYWVTGWETGELVPLVHGRSVREIKPIPVNHQIIYPHDTKLALTKIGPRQCHTIPDKGECTVEYEDKRVGKRRPTLDQCRECLRAYKE